MKKLGIFGISILMILPIGTIAFRKTREEIRHEHIQERIEKRKRIERRDAALMVEKAKARTMRKKETELKELQRSFELQTQVDAEQAYRNEIREFNAIIKALTTGETQRPITELIHEAECRISSIGAYKPRDVSKYKERLEYALRSGTQSKTTQNKKQYSNADLIARESIQTLVEYTKGAAQLVEQVAAQAEEIKYSLNEDIKKQRDIIAALDKQLHNQINVSKKYLTESENRIQKCNTQLAHLNTTLKKTKSDADQKEAEAVNLSQCIDTFNTVSSKVNQDRILKAEKTIRSLESQAEAASKQIRALTLHLEASEKALDAFEEHRQQLYERHTQSSYRKK